MRKIMLAVILSALCVFSLASCGSDTEIPEGMQIVHESDSEGFVFFGPEGWAISNRAGIYATYLSSFNQASVTFTKTDMPSGSLEDYFNESKAYFPYQITLKKSCEAVNFGAPDAAADEAYEFIYTYKHGENDMTCRQILIKNDGEFYIFTYTAIGTPEDEESTYRLYLDRVNSIVSNFRFTEKSGDASASPEYEASEDGYILASDKQLAGFELYVPEDYEIIDSSGIVTAKITNGANISLTKATETGVGILDYMKSRREDMLTVSSGELTDIAIKVAKAVDTESEYFADWTLPLPELDESLKLGNLAKESTASYEYTYSHGGNVYHVYQVFGVDSFNGYVFTYTALESEYSEHLDEVKAVIDRIIFG